MIDWTTLHQSNVNLAFNQLQTKIEECKDKISPVKHVTIPGHKIWKGPWITKGLSNSMNKCTQLYYKNTFKKMHHWTCIININHIEIV